MPTPQLMQISIAMFVSQRAPMDGLAIMIRLHALRTVLKGPMQIIIHAAA